MEALLVALAESSVAILWLFFSVGLEFIGSTVCLLIDLLLSLLKEPTTSPAKPAAKTLVSQDAAESPATLSPRAAHYWPLVRRWLRRLAWASGGLLLATLLLILTASTLLFEPAARWALSGVAKNSGIQIEFQQASGNLFTGRFHLGDARFVRAEHGPSRFDLTAQQAEIDFDVYDLLRGVVHFEEVVITGLRGEFARLEMTETLKTRHDFTIDRLQLTGVNVHLTDATPEHGDVEADVVIASWVCRPLRSRYALFDILFRTEAAQGSVNQAPFRIISQTIQQDRITEWHASRLPLQVVGPYLGKPLRWVKSAEVDWKLIDRSSVRTPGERNLDYHVVLHDVTLEAPDNLPPVARAAVTPLFDLVKKNTRSIPLDFSLQVNETEFEHTLSLGVAGLSAAITDAVTKSLATATGVETDELLETGEKIFNLLKDRIRRRRERS